MPDSSGSNLCLAHNCRMNAAFRFAARCNLVAVTRCARRGLIFLYSLAKGTRLINIRRTVWRLRCRDARWISRSQKMLPLQTTAQDPKNSAGSSSGWTMAGLAIALFGLPLNVGLFTALQIPWSAQNIVLRELSLFAWAGVLAYIIRRKELLGWESVGLQRNSATKTALWVLITIPCLALALFLALGLSKLLGLPLGSADAAKFDRLPIWVLMLVVIRAGFLEEFFYRGYAIDRLQRLFGNRLCAVGVPLVLFAVFHYRQGWAGIIIAFMTGAVLTSVYLYKRNLWIGITAHFLVDFIPNIMRHVL